MKGLILPQNWKCLKPPSSATEDGTRVEGPMVASLTGNPARM